MKAYLTSLRRGILTSYVFLYCVKEAYVSVFWLKLFTRACCSQSQSHNRFFELVEALLQICSCFFSHNIKLYAAYRFQQCQCFAAIPAKISVFNSQMQAGRIGVRWRSGEEASLAPPCSNLRSFESKCIVLKKVLVTRPVTRGESPWNIFRPLENVLDIV